MDLDYSDHILRFSIKNSILENTNTNKNGIGLPNIKKRLSLLYKDSHQLKINEEKNWYNVQLTINTTKLNKYE